MMNITPLLARVNERKKNIAFELVLELELEEELEEEQVLIVKLKDEEEERDLFFSFK